MKLTLKRRGVLVAVIFVCITTLIALRASRSSASPGSSMLVPGVTAAKTVGFAPGGDVDADGKADPGDTLLYTVTVSNSGTDALGVNLNDALSNLTSLNGTANVAPITTDDTYNTIGNVNIAQA